MAEILGIFVVLALISAIINRYEETYRDAKSEGFGSFGAHLKGLGYIALGGCPLAFFIVALDNIESLGYWLIPLGVGVTALCGVLLGQLLDLRPGRRRG